MVSGERGQSAAEYLGILLVIVVIIGLLVSTDIGGQLTELLKSAVDSISRGDGR